MTAANSIPAVGIVLSGAVHDMRVHAPLDEKMDRIAEVGVFDYVEHSPLPSELEPLKAVTARTGVRVRAGNHYYRAGRDEPLLEWHMNAARELGCDTHNMQIFSHDAEGLQLSDQAVADHYLRTYDLAAPKDIRPCMEVHVDMWSERFFAVARVGDLVERRGIPFYLTLDASHLLFKLEQASELAKSGLPVNASSENIITLIDQWIAANWIGHAHARPAAANGPANTWARNSHGQIGRGIQYPFLEPQPGAWHANWHVEKLNTWKLIMKNLLRHHIAVEQSPLRRITAEMIPFVDYGAGASYSLMDNNVAIAQWLRHTWRELCSS